MNKLKLSFFLIPSAAIETGNGERKQVLFATRTGSVITLNSKYVDMLYNNSFEDIPDKILADLIDIEALVPVDQDELAEIVADNNLAIDKDEVLSIVIQPSAACQLGCHYCGQTHSNNNMDALMMSKIVDRIKTKIYLEYPKTLAVTWYGAEPLMGLGQIRIMSPQLIDLAAKNGVQYVSHMVTNGMSLKFDIYKELVDKYHIKSFQITLDGTAEYHDKNRYLKKNQGPSFDIIFKNILEIASSAHYAASGANITVRCNVDVNSAKGLPALIELLRVNNLQKKVGFYLVPVHKWGDNDAEHNTGVERDAFASEEIEWMISLIKAGFEVDILPERKKVVCSSVKKNSEVYDAFGTISSCWEVPYTKPYGGSSYEIGHVMMPNAVNEVDVPMRNWNEDVIKKDFGCNTCRLFPVCGGECPIHWENGTPACPSFKFNIEDRLLLTYVKNQGGL